MNLRTDYCGALRGDDVGREVAVCGWVDRRREHGEHLAFIDLRDHTGVIQCVVDGAHDLRSEYVLRITGTVVERPEGTVNPDLDTGDVELQDVAVEVLSASEPPPFPLHGRTDVDETLRIRHRYVDLRSDRMQANLRARAQVNAAIRETFISHDFVEIETPLLIASTPEGARDFVVPSRLKPGSFYALPQSPQIFKQLCMVGGFDRYFQIVRCLRDEDLRSDRQFEFTQLDMEASFVGGAEVRAIVSDSVASAAERITGERPIGFDEISWIDAAERYGSDKPDRRFGLELVELTDVFAATEFNAFRTASIKGICLPGGADTSRNRLDALTERCKQWGAKGLVWMRVTDDGVDSPIAKFLSVDEIAGVKGELKANTGDLAFLVADEPRVVRHILGLLRLELRETQKLASGFDFFWVTDFPLFEDLDEAGRPVPAHHLFTMPHADDVPLLDSATGEGLLDIRSQAYDLVCNGWEIGSGSVRIHSSDIQQAVFTALGIDPERAKERFGFLLDAFRYGAPPHAGFAYGVDRLVALLVGEENIREVIAFPKTQSGADPLTGAPTPLDQAHLDELGLRTLPPPT